MDPSNSASAPSSPSSTQQPEQTPTMEIFIKPITGETFSLKDLPHDLPISTLRTMMSVRYPHLPSTELRLLWSGKALLPSSTLASNGIPPASTLALAMPARTVVSKKPRCAHKECGALAQRIVGDCGFCGKSYCGKHRLLEDHRCEGLEDCKKESHERNRNKLEGERTVVVKGV